MNTHRKTKQAIATAMLSVFVLQLFAALPAHATLLTDSVGSFKIAADLSRRSSQELAVKQAAAIITNIISNAVDTDGDPFPEPPGFAAGAGPTGGGLVPATLGAPIDDGYGGKLGYCAWDNGTVFTAGANRLKGSNTDLGAVTFAIVSAGLNGKFERTCAEIASNAVTTDDDFVVRMSTNQIRQGLSGTVFFGDPVGTTAILSTLLPADQKDGQLRLVKSDNTLWRFDQAAGAYVPASASPFWSAGANPGQATTASGISQVGIGTSNPGYALEVNSTAIPVGLRSSGQYNGVNFLNGAALSGFVGYDNAASRLYLNGSAGSTIDFAIGGATQLQVAANGRVTALNGITANNGLTVASGVLGAANVALTGGSINGTAIGNVTPSTGAFTTLSGTLTGNVTGNAATASKLQTPVSIGMSGDVNWSVLFDGSTNVSAAGTLSNTGVGAGAYGSATTSPAFTVDSRGRIVAAANTLITPAFSSITGTPTTATGYGILGIDGVPIGATTPSSGAFTSINVNAGLNAAGGNLVLSSTGISNVLAARPAAGIVNRIFIATDTNEIYRDTGAGWSKIGNGAATASTALSGLGVAVANNTLANGTFAQAWNWSLSGNSSAFAIGESIASSGGTGAQYLFTAGTLAGSTAIPFAVSTRGVEAFRVDSVNPQLVANNGAVAAPSYSFAGDGGTGFYLPAAAQLGASIGGINSLRITAGSLSMGKGALALDTSATATALGTNALAANTTGAGNTAVGLSALVANSSGGQNTAIGYQALFSNGGASGNTAVGYRASAAYNVVNGGTTALGAYALENSTSSRNTAVGFAAMQNGSGQYNVAMGISALQNGSGGDNTAIGGEALASTTSGGGNVAVGRQAGYASFVAFGGDTTNRNITGARNTFLGSFAMPGTTTQLNYASALGSDSRVTTSNTIALGRTIDTTVIGATGISAVGNLNGALLQVTGNIGATGAVNAATFAGNGAALTNLNASNIATGILAVANGGTGVTTSTGTGSVVLSASPTFSGTVNGAALTLSGNNTAATFMAGNGLVGAPSYTFTGATTTGFYLPAAGQLAATVAGTRSMWITGGSTGVGIGALFAETAPTNNNSAFGNSALASNSIGTANTAVGEGALFQNTSGTNNVAIGRRAGQATTANVGTNANVSGNSNTFVGAYAMPGTATQLNFATALGSEALVTTANTVVLGRATDKTIIGATGDDGSAFNLQVTGGIKALSGGLRVAGGDLVLNSPTVTGLLAARPVAGIAGRLYIATDTNQLYRDDGTAWNLFAAGSAALSSVTAATAANTINNGANTQMWNWQLAANTTAFNISENAASTGGTGTQYLTKIGTLAASTAIPLSVSTRGTEAFHVDSVNPQIVANAGTVAAPTYSFAGTQGTGFYSPAAGVLAAATNGVRSLYVDNNNSQNTSLGTFAGVGAAGNTIIGFSAGASGNYNTAVGRYALRPGGGLGNNSAFGASALYNTSAEGNAAFGFNTGLTNTTGTYNTLIGTSADVASAALTYATVLGSGASVSTSSTIVLGRTTDITVIGATGNDGSAYNLQVTGGIKALTGGIKAGAGTASVAPLQFTSGINLTTPAAGAVEYDGTNLYFTPAALRKTVAFTDSNITGNAANVTGVVAVANGGTGATTAAAARSNLGAAASGANSDITSLSGLTTALSVVQGGTGTTTSTGTGSVVLNASPTFTGTITGNANVEMTSGQYLRFGHANQFNVDDGKIGAGLFSNGLNIVGTQTVAAGGRLTTIYGNVNALNDINVTGVLTASGGSKIVVQNGQDGGPGRGIYMATGTDSNWGLYMGQAGAGKSLSGGTAAASIDGRTGTAIRSRVLDNPAATFIWENSSEKALMSLNGAYGSLFAAGNISAGNDITATGTLSGKRLYLNDGAGLTYQNLIVSDVAMANPQAGGFGANTVFGGRALFYNTSGAKNVAVGGGAIQGNSTGSQNVAVGLSALSSNTTGIDNVAIGTAAMSNGMFGSFNPAVSTGSNNLAMGTGALYVNTTGSNNQALGHNSLQANTTGQDNATLGSYTLYDNTTGSYNVAVGLNGGRFNTTGSYNVALGHSAGTTNTIGTNNTAIGYGANTASNALTYATALGSGAIVSTANTVALGRTTDTVVVGATGTTFGGGKLQVTGTGISNYSGAIGSNASYTLGRTGNEATLAVASANAQYSTNAVAGDVILRTEALGANLIFVNGANPAALSIVNNNVTVANQLTASGGVNVAGGNLVLGSANVSGTLAARPAFGVANRIYIATDTNEIYRDTGTAWTRVATGAPTPALSALVAATTNNTISNGAFAQTWNWAQTANTTAFALGESAAATGGTGTQYLQTIGTLPASTAIPLSVSTRGAEAFRVDSVNPQIVANGGTVSAPSYSFSGSQATGFYLPTTNQLGASLNGVRSLWLTGGSIAFGQGALSVDTSLTATAFGTNALAANTTAVNNSAFGFEAMKANTSAVNVTAVGYRALWTNTTGSANVAVGSAALTNSTTGGYNIAIGSTAMASNTIGAANTAIGDGVLSGNTTGFSNVAIGAGAGFTAFGGVSTNKNISGSNNTFIGTNALPGTTTQLNYATVIGSDAVVTTANTIVLGRALEKTVIGATGTDGSANNLQVTGGIKALTGGIASTSFVSALRIDVSAPAGVTYSNTIIGATALPLTQSGLGANTAVGESALSANTSGAYNVALGSSTLRSNTTGNDNTAVGINVLYTNITGTKNVALGNNSLYGNTTGTNNIAAGYSALGNNAGGSSNVSIGTYSMYSNTAGNTNTAVGDYSLYFNTGTSNTATGSNALLGNTSGDSNTAVGKNALYSTGTSSNNSALGGGAGYTSTTLTAGNSTFIGNGASIADNAIMAGTGRITLLGANTSASGLGAAVSNAYMTAIGSGAAVTTVNTVALGRTNDKTVIGATGDDGSAYNLQVTGGIKAVTGGVSIAAGDLVLGSTNVSGTLAARPAFGVANRVYIATDTNEIYRDTGTAWTRIASGTPTSALSGIIAATANNTIANGAFSQTWNWAQTANTTAFALGESAAAIGGTGTQYLAKIETLAASTAIPFSVSTRSTEVFRVDSINPQLLANNGTASIPTYSFAGQTSTGFYLPAADELGASVAGSRSLWLSSGRESTALGIGSLAVATSTGNTGVGKLALNANTTGTSNTALGGYSAYRLTTGSSSTAVGYASLNYQTTGSANTALGWFAGTTTTNPISSNSSVFIGASASIADTVNMAASGRITLIGANTSASGLGAANAAANMTAIGYGASVTTANTVVLGTTADKTVIGASGTDGTAYNLQVTGGIKAVTGGMSIAAGDLVLGSTNVSGTLAARPAFGVANRIYIATDTNEIYRDTGTAWTRVATGAPTPALSALVAATANNTIANGAFAQTWNWAQTTNTTAFALGESAAATGGTGTQYLAKVSTLAASTAIPLSVSTRGVEAFRVDSINPQVVANNGTVAAPAYSFAGQQSTGLYLPAAGQLGASIAGARSLWITNGSTGLGVSALLNDSAATNNNSAFGNSALGLTTTGTFNTAIGEGALYSNTIGTNNVAMGRRAGHATAGNVGTNANISGSNNTFLGAYAMPGTATQLSYATALGSEALVSSSNTIVLGRATDKTVIGAANTDGSPRILQVNGRAGVQTLQVNTHTAIDVQGAYLQWNRGNGDGRTYLVNQKGLGSGGISFGEATTADAYTQTMQLDSAGNLSTAGTVAATTGTLAAPGLTFNGNTSTGFYVPAAGQLAASVGGFRSLFLNSTTLFNTGLGLDTLSGVTTGSANTAVGWRATGFAGDTTNSTAIGFQALIYTTGNSNTAVGANALQGVTGGGQNSALGNAAGLTTTNFITASNSTFIGANATIADTAAMAGSGQITLIGAGATASGLGAATTNAYMTALGAGASVTTINTVVLGRTNDKVVIGQTNSNATYKFYVNGTAGGTSAYVNASDARYKMNVTPVVNAINTIKSLQGVHYEFNRAAFPQKDFETGRQLGFIAQQIETFVPEVVRTDAEGFKGVQYSQLVPLLVEGIKEQQQVLRHLLKKDPTTLLVDIKTFQGSDAVFDNIKSTNIKTANLEAETARIKKLDADRIDAKLIRSDVMKTGEVELFVGMGSFQPIFNPEQNSQYIVNATAEDGSSAFASVAYMSGRVTVTPISGKGVDISAIGTQVGLVAASKKIKATWIRMS